MTDFDLLVVSLGLNLCFLAYFYAQRVKVSILVKLAYEAKRLITAIADGKAIAVRDGKGDIRIKEVKREENKPSTTAV